MSEIDELFKSLELEIESRLMFEKSIVKDWGQDIWNRSIHKEICNKNIKFLKDKIIEEIKKSCLNE